MTQARLDRYKPWFYAAAGYNFVWGAIAILFPSAYFRLIDMKTPEPEAIWQVVGMFVLVFAPGYWWAARRPERHAHLIAIGLAGKLLGPAGFVFSLATDALPLRFGLTLLTNDLIWWVPFALYLREAALDRGGWRAFLVEG